MATREEQRSALIDAIQAGLRPLVELLFRHEVTLQDLKEAISGLYVYDTAERLKREGRPTTAARLALMTGLTRGEVERYLTARAVSMRRRSVGASEAQLPAVVLAVWNTQPQFSTPYGVALDLPIEDADRKSRTFRHLVETAAPGSDPDTILDQLVAAGCVEVVRGQGNADDFVRCTDRAYIPATVSIERLSHLGVCMAALTSNLAHNISVQADERYIERRVQCDFPLSKTGHEEVRAWMSSEGLRFLEILDTWLTGNRARLEGDAGQPSVGLEVFMYDIQRAEEPDVSGLAAANQ